MQILNARTQQLENVTWNVDRNNELVASFADGSFLKFPAGLSLEELGQLVDKHYQSNVGQEVITQERLAAEEAQRQASNALLAQLNGNTMPEGSQNNAPVTPQEAPAIG